jgi:hypothetical protein
MTKTELVLHTIFMILCLILLSAVTVGVLKLVWRML